MGVTTRAFQLGSGALKPFWILPACFPVIPRARALGAIGYRRRQWEAGGGAHSVCLQERAGSVGPREQLSCLLWRVPGVFSATIITNETYSNAGIHTGVIQLEFCCSTMAPAVELPAAFSCAALCWVCTVRGGGSPGAVRCSSCASIMAKLHKTEPSPWGKKQ